MAKKPKVEKKTIKIDGNIGTWEVRLEGTVLGTYVGTFKFKCFLTPLQRIAANREYRELLGTNPAMAGTHESELAYALTQLKYRIHEAPPFWTSAESGGLEGDIPDENVILKVLEAAIDTELLYREELKQKKIDALKRAKAAAEKVLEESDSEGEDQTDSD